ncbi:FMN-binding negative transcriptional regulator [Parafrankia sp. FMc2]|uniref:FMN-binding negative transcriptional regulator n=1 Tax=Parafrankia sp. FMc2 TaxID=3233196 RepID=UPI0034D4E085
MFVPDIYQNHDHAQLRNEIRRHPLAVLAGNGDPTPLLTHLPVIPHPDEGGAADAPLPGSVLLGHMNRANPHWAALTDGSAATLIFLGPHGYVKPALYQTTPAAPTWDFVSIHAHGTAHPIPAGEETLDVVRWTVDALERSFGSGWDPRPSLGYFRSIVPGVGAFRFEVTGVDTMYKLSQEQTAERQDQVAASFAASEGGCMRELAELMRVVRHSADPADVPR